MAYQQGSYDYYSQSQYPTTDASSYSSYDNSSQSFPSQVSYSTTTSGQDTASYQTQGYAAVTAEISASASGDNQGSQPYQSYQYTSSYDYGNVPSSDQSNYNSSQSQETYGSSYNSNYSQSSTSGQSAAVSVTSQTQGQEYYYTQSQNQTTGEYYTGYQTTASVAVANQPSQSHVPPSQSQYPNYGSHVSAGQENTNQASDQAYQYSYGTTNISNNSNATINSQTQDWTASSSQVQAVGGEQSATYYNATPQIPYGSTHSHTQGTVQQTDQNYYSYSFDPTPPSNQSYAQRTEILSGSEAPKQPHIPRQQYGNQSRFDARPGGDFNQPDRSRNNQGLAVANQSYQAASQTDWNVRNNPGTGSQFAGQLSQQSNRNQPIKENRHQFEQTSQHPTFPNKPTFSSVIGHLSELLASKTRGGSKDVRTQSNVGKEGELKNSRNTEEGGHGSTLSNLRPIMPSSMSTPSMHSRLQPQQKNQQTKPVNNWQSFTPNRGNYNVAHGKESVGLNETVARGRMPGSQGQFNQMKDNVQRRFPQNQIQWKQEQTKQQDRGDHKKENKGLGSQRDERSMTTGGRGPFPKGGHNNLGQPVGRDQMPSSGAGAFPPRLPGAVLGPRGPHNIQQGGSSRMGPRGPDRQLSRGPSHISPPRGSGDVLPRGPGPRPPRGGDPVPPRGPFPMPPKGPPGIEGPNSSPHKRQRFMDDDKKKDKRSQRMPSPSPLDFGRPQGPPFRPRGPHDRPFRFGPLPGGEMFGPRFRGPPSPDMYFEGPRGFRPRHPFGPRRPGPWDAVPPGFPLRMRGPFPFREGKHDREDHGLPSMLEPLRKRRRSSGSSHSGGGDPVPLMTTSGKGPPRDGPVGPQPLHFPSDVSRGMQPPPLPNKQAVPQFTGTKAGKFGKFLTEKKNKAEVSDAKKSMRKGTEDKFMCDFCQVGFTTKQSLTEHTKQHKHCDMEGCGFEGVTRVVQLHKQQAHQPNIPAVKWSRDKDDVHAWIEERKRNFPTAATVAAKKAVQADKERVGAVLTTKEFGKMKQKKQVSKTSREDALKETRDGEKYVAKDDTKDKLTEKDEGKREAEEGSKGDEVDSKEEVKGKLKKEVTCSKEGAEKESKGDEITSQEEETVEAKEDGAVNKEEPEERPEGGISNDKEKSTKETEIRADVEMEDLEKSDVEERQTEGMKGTPIKKEENFEDNEKENASDGIERKSDDKDSSSACKKEVTFQVVKKEVKRFRSGKGSKGEAWQTSRPVQKFIASPGGHRRATLLEMLLAPEMRHERNLVLQCVRHTIKNNFFEPPKTEVLKTTPVILKVESAEGQLLPASHEEQIEKRYAGETNCSAEEEKAKMEDQRTTSNDQETENVKVECKPEDSISQEEGGIHQEMSGIPAVMDVSPQVEQEESPPCHKEGVDSGTRGSVGNLLEVIEKKEQNFPALGKGESDEEGENIIHSEQEDVDSERTFQVKQCEVDTEKDVENLAEKGDSDAEEVKGMDDSFEEKMDTDHGEHSRSSPEEGTASDEEMAEGLRDGDKNEEGTQFRDASSVCDRDAEAAEISEELGDYENSKASGDTLKDDDDDVMDETDGADTVVEGDAERVDQVEERRMDEKDEMLGEHRESENEGDDMDTVVDELKKEEIELEEDDVHKTTDGSDVQERGSKIPAEEVTAVCEIMEEGLGKTDSVKKDGDTSEIGSKTETGNEATAEVEGDCKAEDRETPEEETTIVEVEDQERGASPEAEEWKEVTTSKARPLRRSSRRKR